MLKCAELWTSFVESTKEIEKVVLLDIRER